MKIETPKYLTPPAAEIWRDIVKTLPAGHLKDADLPLFAEYCEVLASLHEGRQQWRKLGSPWTKEHKTGAEGPHPLLSAIQRHVGTLSQLAGKLRLCPSARLSADAAGRQQHKRPGKSAMDFLK